MINYNRKSFIHQQLIDDWVQYSEKIIIEKKNLKQKIFIFTLQIKEFLFIFSYEIMPIYHLQTKALKKETL